MTVDRTIREKRTDFIAPHCLWMTLGMKEDESFEPLHLGFFSSKAIVPGTNRQAHPIQKFWLATIIGEMVAVRHHLTQQGRERVSDVQERPILTR